MQGLLNTIILLKTGLRFTITQKFLFFAGLTAILLTRLDRFYPATRDHALECFAFQHNNLAGMHLCQYLEQVLVKNFLLFAEPGAPPCAALHKNVLFLFHNQAVMSFLAGFHHDFAFFHI